MQTQLCIFCGGAAAATTKEHCPPKALFQNRQWPEGFEFPACARCNNGTTDDDVLVALVGRIDPLGIQGNKDGKVVALMRNVANQYSNPLAQMFGRSAIEARRYCRERGIRPPFGMTYQQIVPVPERLDKAVITLARKLTKALFYRETNNIFPKEGEIQFNWFTNEAVFIDGSSAVLDGVAQFKAIQPKIARSGKNLNDQFDCRYSLSADGHLAILQALFGRSFGFVTVASSTAGVLSQVEENVMRATGMTSGPFRFI